MRYWVLFVFVISALPGTARAQWISTYNEDPFGTDHVTAAFTARSGKALGVRCIGGKRLELLFLPNEQGDEAIAAVANIQGAKLLVRIDGDPSVSLKASMSSDKGKIISMAQTDRRMALRIAAARRRVAVALSIAGNKFGTVSLGVRGSRKHIEKVLKACRPAEIKSRRKTIFKLDSIAVIDNGRPVASEVKTIKQSDWGEKWPFTVPQAALVCVKPLGPYGQFYVVDGVAFAANGSSSSMGKRGRIKLAVNGSLQSPKLIDVDDEDGARLWREAERPAGISKDEPWVRISVGVMIEALGKMGCR